jgi:hypothetical protein
MAFGAFRRFGLGQPRAPGFGRPHALRGGPARGIVGPKPTPPHPHLTPADQATWYDRLADRLC